MTTSEDSSETPQARAARRAAQRTPEARRAFGLLHSTLAKQHWAIAKLWTGSIPRKIAIKALNLYPDVRQKGSLGRSEVAIKQAIEAVLPETEERQRYEEAIGVARRAVKRALGATHVWAKKARAEAQAQAQTDADAKTEPDNT